MSKRNLRDMSDEEISSTLDEIEMRANDPRYPDRLKLWVIVKRCEQIAADEKP